MIVRFALPWDDFRQWAITTYRDGVVPLIRRGQRRSRDLSDALPALPWKVAIPTAIALFAFANARSVLSPSAVGQSFAAHDALVLMPASAAAPTRQYAWLASGQRAGLQDLNERIHVEDGWARLTFPVGSFGDWLRHLPMQSADVPVRDYRKRPLDDREQTASAGAFALQPHTNKLGPAAMMVRLRAEYLWATQSASAASFHFNTGQRMDWSDWSRGLRASFETGTLKFVPMGKADSSRSSYCAYLESVFLHTDTKSLLDDSRPVTDGTIAPGDLMIRNEAGNEHVVMVVDLAVDPDGQIALLLAQGHTPAATLHLCMGPDESPWHVVYRDGLFDLGANGTVHLSSLRRWH